jgi:hypothetical protein
LSEDVAEHPTTTPTTTLAITPNTNAFRPMIENLTMIAHRALHP